MGPVSARDHFIKIKHLQYTNLALLTDFSLIYTINDTQNNNIKGERGIVRMGILWRTMDIVNLQQIFILNIPFFLNECINQTQK